MKKFLSHPYVRIAKDVMLLFFLLYYCTIVAAKIYPYDDGWGISLLKGLPLFALLVFGWLYFFKFRVLTLTYQAIAMFSCILFVIIYYPFFPLNYVLHLGPRMNGGNYTSHSISVWLWIENIALTLNKHVLVWSPYIFFIYFLSSGLQRKCQNANWYMPYMPAKRLVENELEQVRGMERRLQKPENLTTTAIEVEQS